MAGRFQQGSQSSRSAQPAPRPAQDPAPLNHEQERIRQWLTQVKFRKNLFGGVDEADVWKKLGELNSLYEAALSAERARYDALLSQRRDDRG